MLLILTVFKQWLVPVMQAAPKTHSNSRNDAWVTALEMLRPTSGRRIGDDILQRGSEALQWCPLQPAHASAEQQGHVIGFPRMDHTVHNPPQPSNWLSGPRHPR